MRRLVVVLAAVSVFAGPPATWALADQGSPGTTFPEQPGGNVATGCQAVISAPGEGPGSPVAQAITTGLLEDACP
ncbi:MAG: hypothetical protein ACRDHS_04725 [Actinomycetota bacterium]